MRGLVDEGVIIGTLFAWQIGAAARECDEATWPSIATTWFWLISFVTTVEASSGLDWSSSTRSLICCPRTPPAPLTSSKAIWEPSRVEMPKVAIPPVRDPYSPTRIAPPDPPLPQDKVAARTTDTRAQTNSRVFIFGSLLKAGYEKRRILSRSMTESQNPKPFNRFS